MFKQDNKNVTLFEKDIEKLIYLDIDPLSNRFSRLLTKTFEDCDSLSLDLSSKKSYELTKEEFKENLKITFSKMQKYLNK